MYKAFGGLEFAVCSGKYVFGSFLKRSDFTKKRQEKILPGLF